MHEEAEAQSAYAHSAGILAESIVKKLSAQNKTIAAAESCTGGMAADLIIRIPGASRVFWGSFVSYTEDAKVIMLGVPPELIKEFGVVSRETAIAMAEGARKKSGASWAFSVTGLAGPDGDGLNPVGTVWIAVAGWKGDIKDNMRTEAKMLLFNGNRNEIREKAATAALEMVFEKINNK